MTPAERWQRVQQLCDEAEGLPPSAREALLAGVDDEQVREQARSMLQALEAEARASAAFGSPAGPDSPESVGSYRITGLLGRGATGTVYSAERGLEGATQRVAVKLLHLHLTEGDSAARFLREQRILASLEHPGICRIFDAGVTGGGQPYLVMELVEGRHLVEHADANQLTVAERIGLVIQACRAVHAAHQRLVVHLDLKPENIIVSAAGSVRLLDFGTAKLIDPSGGLTTTRQLTPLYASPEQLRGEPVSTACDIYSLGLILYELLSGTWPFGSRTSLVAVAERAAGTTTARRLDAAVTEEIAARRRASADRLRLLLQGDISAVVAKAMAGPPEGRYASAADLADDLQRCLDQRPVLARRQTVTYRARKYVRRHAGFVSAGAIAAVALAAALGYGAWQQYHALAQGRRAEATTQFLLWMIQSSNPLYGGQRDLAVRDLVVRAGDRLDSAAVLDLETSSRLGASLGWYAFAAGREADGAAMLEQALERARRSGSPAAAIGALSTLGQMALSRGDCAEATARFAEGQRLSEANLRALTPDERASFLVSLSQVKDACERGADVLGLTREAVALALKVPDDSTRVTIPPPVFKALVLNGHTVALTRARDFAAARQAATDGLGFAAAHPDGRSARIALLRSLAAVEYGEKNVSAAARALEEAADLARGHSGPFEEIRLQVMAARRWAEAGDTTRAVSLTDRALAAAASAGEAIAQTRWMILIDGAMAYQNAGQCARALDVAGQARQSAPASLPPQWAGNLASVEGLCLAETAPGEAARAKAREALALLAPFFAPGSPLKARLDAVAAPQ